jgi:cytochrome c oxidase cbb3-type subunit 3
MTDFVSIFWDYYVALLSVISIAGCAVLLWMQGRHRIVVKPGETPDTSGHVWDEDLREYQNPMPRWWIILFYLTIAFSVLYLALYPGLGTQFKGSRNWTSAAEHDADVRAAVAKYGPVIDGFLKQDLAAVAADPRAREMGERLFLNNCAQCHGSDARGSRGVPNLTDNEWLYGSSPEAIKTTITKGRQGAMPPMAQAVGGPEDVADVAHYVLSLSDSAHDSVRAARGKSKFAACGACHGPEGKGNQQLGAPDLTNKLWLYGGSVATITETIAKGRQGAMPAWEGILTEGEIHLLAAYVLSLGPMATASGTTR